MAKKKAKATPAAVICVSMPVVMLDKVRQRALQLNMGRSEYFRWLMRRDTEVKS